MLKFLIKNLLLIFIFLNLIQVNSYSNPKVDVKTAILIDYDSESVLYELEPDMQIYPASMTKIMTTIVVFDLLKKGRLSLEEEFIISEKAWRLSQSGYSSMFVMVNDQVSVEDLLRGIIVVSGNDACVAIAEGIAGTEENFAEIMNEKAAEIGMTNTNFANASGINDPDNYSTVRDIAMMSKYLIKNYPEFYELYKEKSFTWDRTGGDPITQGNRNALLYKKVGVDGIKTGYLAVEKYSLASSMKREERRLISVASGFQNKSIRSSGSLKILSWGFRNTETFKVSKQNETIFNVKSWLGKEKEISGITKEDIFITLNKKESRNLKVILKYNGPIRAPIKKDQKIANIDVLIKDKVVKSVPVYASEEVEKVNFFKSLFMSINYLIWGDV
jgi:D-alanyl-D-alanine carboxypeptidase (penicillin-binding protein 5/6)|tara:strand:+ start:1856 stop:3019 length:1164 start_codon:yes stop_codon:yes gene_type:complete